jgi:predicted dehydrogenase
MNPFTNDAPTRRHLLAVAGAAGVLARSSAAPAAGAASAPGGGGAGEIAVAVVGCGGMGRSHLSLLSRREGVRIAWVCDVDADRLAAAARIPEEAGRSAPRATADFREVLADEEVRAVWIATPDHWHAPAAILAADAGRHVYVEKPCSHNVREGRLMVEAARRNGVVMQVGTQSRSTPHVRRAIEKLRSGAIGDVLVAKAWNSQRRGSIGRREPAEPPAALDYDRWVGPAAWHPYRPNLLHGTWRFWRGFGTGDIGNDGVHEIDIARWGLGVDGHPERVAGLGGKFFFDDDQEFPDTQYCLYEWPAPGGIGTRQLVFEQRDWSPYVQEGHENGNAFYGTKGLLVLGKNRGWQLFGERNRLVEEDRGATDVAAHHDDFLTRVAEGGRPAADIEEGHRSATLAHLGTIACRVGRTLRFDPAAERIREDAEANEMLGRTYRDGHWAVPRSG